MADVIAMPGAKAPPPTEEHDPSADTVLQEHMGDLRSVILIGIAKNGDFVLAGSDAPLFASIGMIEHASWLLNNGARE